MPDPGSRTACRTLLLGQRHARGRCRSQLTEEQLVLVHDVADAKVCGAKDHNERLNDTVEHRDDKDENGLWVYCAVVDHWWCIELGKVYRMNVR